jgi:hypothetical protein
MTANLTEIRRDTPSPSCSVPGFHGQGAGRRGPAFELIDRIDPPSPTVRAYRNKQLDALLNSANLAS